MNPLVEKYLYGIQATYHGESISENLMLSKLYSSGDEADQKVAWLNEFGIKHYTFQVVKIYHLGL